MYHIHHRHHFIIYTGHNVKYIEQTGRKLKTRFKEHIDHIHLKGILEFRTVYSEINKRLYELISLL